MFQKGEWVRVTMPGDQIDGLEGVVVDVNNSQMWPVVARFDYFGVPPFDWPFEYHELEKIYEES